MPENNTKPAELCSILKDILDRGGNPNFWSNEETGSRRSLLFLSITEALATDNWEKVDLLMGYEKTDPSLRCEKTNRNCLDLAYEHKNFDLCRKIIRHKPAIVNEQIPEKMVVPLHTAAYDDDLEYAALLCLHGANINVSDRFGQPPLFFAQSKGMVQFLLDKGADIAHLNHRGQCCLHVLSASSCQESVSAIVRIMSSTMNDESLKSFLNLQDEHGRTPLHLAAGKGSQSCIGTLLDYGADPTIKTKKGACPITFAEKQGQDEAAYFLHIRWTGSRRAPWRERLQNPPFLFALTIMGTAMFLNRQLVWDVFLDIVDPLPIPGNMQLRGR